MRTVTYTPAETLETALQAFAEAGTEGRYLAGGTTLYDLMKLGVERPAHLIDLSRITGLDTIETDGDELRFGAMAPMSDVAAIQVVQTDYPLLRESLLKAASQQLRNMATVGGNLLQRTRCPYFRAGNGVYPCNRRLPGSGCAAIGGLDRSQAVLGTSEACTAVAPGDWPVALVALDARIEIAGPEGQRSMPVADLYRLPGDTPEREFEIGPGDIITAVVVPKTAVARASTYHKVRDRESFAFALASAAVAIETDGAVVQDVRIALGGVATVPWRAKAAEEAIRGKEVTRERALAAGRAAFEGARPGHHNSFKLELGAHVIADALMIAADRSRT
ncbi:FAD binding domain-containing protein [Marinivivus vitaminiproducens]|uniref:FAD binding domain-containing protein n=1 Tax=Marinivivus vitaminiproducens TaxID=3035935 RepID=UPI0027A8BA1F|nr:xanthine dehydrogenase family protein subunit M [Geminicoccaceae bacterium SCSIO 64248]